MSTLFARIGHAIESRQLGRQSQRISSWQQQQNSSCCVRGLPTRPPNTHIRDDKSTRRRFSSRGNLAARPNQLHNGSHDETTSSGRPSPFRGPDARRPVSSRGASSRGGRDIIDRMVLKDEEKIEVLGSEDYPGDKEIEAMLVDEDDRGGFERWEGNSADQVDHDTADDAQFMPNGGINWASIGNPDLLNGVDYEAQLPEAMRLRDTDLVLRCLFAACKNNDYRWIRSIPNVSFTAILELLRPSHYVLKIIHEHHNIGDETRHLLKLAPATATAKQYTTMLHYVERMREESGARLTLDDYRILLEAARDLDRPVRADRIWNRLFESGLTPDVDCYNYYMAAQVFVGVHVNQARTRARVTPANVAQRAKRTRSAAWRTYRIGDEGNTIGTKARRIFNMIAQAGLSPNTETYRVLIAAVARNGEINDVKNILLQVWNIDVDAFADSSKPRPTPRQFSPDSPLRPTTELLCTIAEAFGINNDMATAIRLVDYMSQCYGVPLTRDVWKKMIEWTFVLTQRGPNERSRTDKPLLPLRSPSNLWDIMTTGPQSITPTLNMYRFIMKNLFYRNEKRPMINLLEKEIYPLYQQRLGEVRTTLWNLKQALARSRDGIRETEVSQTVTFCREQWDLAELRRQSEFHQLRAFINLFLAKFAHWTRNDADLALAAVPRMLWTWRKLVPRVIKYETQTAMLRVYLKPPKRNFRDWRRHRLLRRHRALRKQAPRFVGDSYASPRSVTWPAAYVHTTARRRLVQRLLEKSEASSEGAAAVRNRPRVTPRQRVRWARLKRRSD